MIFRPLLASALLLCVSETSSFAQTSGVIHYYKDQWGSKEVTSDKAKYSKHIRHEEDGTTVIEWRYIPNNTIIHSESYREGAPVGLWITANKNGKVEKELDYRFTLRYTNDSCSSGYRYRFGDTLVARVPGVFVAPKLKGYKDLTDMLVKSIRYPDPAREAGIEGRVILTMKLTEQGKLADIMVLKGTDKVLDAEAARLFFKPLEWTPATLDGKPIALCITCPITFRLD